MNEIESALETYKTKSKDLENGYLEALAHGVDRDDNAELAINELNIICDALRSQLTREQNEPLTLEELKGMDVPVWWVDCGQGAWAECNVEEYFKNFITVWFFGNECEDNIAFDRYGISYFAYRSKPNK